MIKETKSTKTNKYSKVSRSGKKIGQYIIVDIELKYNCYHEKKSFTCFRNKKRIKCEGKI